MAKIVWSNQPTNHSGTVNFLYLNPDGEVGNFTIYVADGGGPYILGGPALSHDNFQLRDAALRLIAQLPVDFHFYPPASEARFRQAVRDNRAEIRDNSPLLGEDYWELRTYSQAYTTTQCCDLLLNDMEPTAAIVFVDEEEEGMMLLAAELARIYYGLSKAQRDELGLKADWRHHFEG